MIREPGNRPVRVALFGASGVAAHGIWKTDPHSDFAKAQWLGRCDASCLGPGSSQKRTVSGVRMSFKVHKSILFSGVAFAALVSASGAFAQGATGISEQIVVVANRAPLDLAKVGSSVTVLDDTKIQQLQTVEVSDLLTQTPGITSSSSGGPGSATAIRIRGAEAGHTLVLIDGVQMNDPSSADDAYDFGNLLVGDISRIEVLRGSASTLYGSQAIGGVVNIITPQAMTDGFSGSLQGEEGSLNTGLVKGALGGRFDKFRFRVAGGFYTTDSVSALDSHFGATETDPARNSTFTGRAEYDFTPDISLDLRAFYSDAKYSFDGFPAPKFVFADEGDFGTTRQLVGYAGLNVALFDGRLKNKFDYQATNENRGNFIKTGTVTTTTSHFTGDNRRFEYQGNFAIADGYNAVFGFQNENSEIKSAAPALASSWINSYYGQVTGEVIKGLTLTAGGREDQHKTFGNHFTGQASAAWDLDTGTILRASFGQGFKAPTLYQLYSVYGTATLKPEQSNSWDAGFEQHFFDDSVMLGATYFSRHTRNQINFLTPVCPGAPQCATQKFGFYVNTGITVTNGIELQGSYKILQSLLLTSNYTHELARDHTPGATFLKFLPRRPNDTWNTALDYTWDFGLSTGATAEYRSSSYDNNTNTRKLSGYALFNLRASYPVEENLDLYGRIDNVGDKFYETSYQFGTWGRTGFAGLRAHF
jgi:vitamin B12 transporter